MNNLCVWIFRFRFSYQNILFKWGRAQDFHTKQSWFGSMQIHADQDVLLRYIWRRTFAVALSWCRFKVFLFHPQPQEKTTSNKYICHHRRHWIISVYYEFFSSCGKQAAETLMRLYAYCRLISQKRRFEMFFCFTPSPGSDFPHNQSEPQNILEHFHLHHKSTQTLIKLINIKNKLSFSFVPDSRLLKFLVSYF